MGRPKKYETVEEARQARAKHAKERRAEIKLQEEDLKKKGDVTANTARTARLQKTSASQRRKREEESTEEKLKRQKLDALAHKQKRQTEMDRQERDAASHSELRKTESFEATETRRAKDANSLSRDNEDENSETQRLLKDRQIYTKRILAKANQNQQNLKQVAHNVTNDEASIIEHSVGAMDVVCESCGAYHFAAEKPSDGKFTQCCQKGKVDLSQVIVPSLMEASWKGKHVYSKNFMDNVASINSLFAFASMGAKIAFVDKEIL